MSYKFQYDVGDLVEFVEGRLGASRKRTGIVTQQSFRFTKDDRYKIKTEDGKDVWTHRGLMTLLSKATKG